jgi:hypothetical protein
MQMYAAVCEVMSKLIKESNFEFRRDPLYTPGFLPFMQVRGRNGRYLQNLCKSRIYANPCEEGYCDLI